MKTIAMLNVVLLTGCQTALASIIGLSDWTLGSLHTNSVSLSYTHKFQPVEQIPFGEPNSGNHKR